MKLSGLTQFAGSKSRSSDRKGQKALNKVQQVQDSSDEE
jgi:hypothetical protein